MIKQLRIENFKSIKKLSLDCKKINLFIGEPNVGKSNLLESLSIFSLPYTKNLRDFVRFEKMSNLFYDENLKETLLISIFSAHGRYDRLAIRFENSKFIGLCEYTICEYAITTEVSLPKKKGFYFDYDLFGSGDYEEEQPLRTIKFYHFSEKKEYPRPERDFLLPPSGDNLLAVIMGNKELKALAARIFQPYGLKLIFKPQEDKIEVVKFYEEDVFISTPYSLVSDTLQRIVFYLAAIESNKDSILIFEEPESHSFPYYTKFLAERIALDEKKNQYFISTHNPYLLLSVLEKAKKEEVGVFIIYFKDYQTEVKALTEKELEEILEQDIDVFFNLRSFTGEAE